MYISITGLKVKSLLQAPLFWWHAIASGAQARSAAGNLFVEVRRIDGVQHTLTGWADRQAMRRFMTSGAHLKAVRAFRQVGSGSTCGYEAETRPDWHEALTYWRENGREY